MTVKHREKTAKAKSPRKRGPRGGLGSPAFRRDVGRAWRSEVERAKRIGRIWGRRSTTTLLEEWDKLEVKEQGRKRKKDAGWPSGQRHPAHTRKIAGSNPAPATRNKKMHHREQRSDGDFKRAKRGNK